MSTTLLLEAILAIASLYIVKVFLSGKRGAQPLPPGPVPKFIIGNFHDLPPHGVKDWEHWLRHKDLYGELILANHADSPNPNRQGRSALSRSWDRQ